MKFNPTYAPRGYKAVEDKDWDGCDKCAFFAKANCPKDMKCLPSKRPDGCKVYFVKQEVLDPATVGMGERSFKEWPVTEK